MHLVPCFPSAARVGQAKKDAGMEGQRRYPDRLSRFVHRHFLLLLLTAYAVAAVAPRVGVAATRLMVGHIVFLHEPVPVTLPKLLLAGLLLSAGLGVEISELASVVKKPQIVLAGLLANLLVP